MICAFFLEWGFEVLGEELTILTLISPITDVESFILLSQVLEEVGELLIFVRVWMYYLKFILQARPHMPVQSGFSNSQISVTWLPKY